ncbi:hypothetical protein D3C87_475670 [compost metagenome]
MYRCPECRTRRRDHGLFTQHIRATGHKLCQCGHVAYGGTAFPHRRGSPFCEHNPLSALYLADRDGATDEDLMRCARYIMKETPHAAAKVRELLKEWKLK